MRIVQPHKCSPTERGSTTHVVLSLNLLATGLLMIVGKVIFAVKDGVPYHQWEQASPTGPNRPL